MMSVTSIFVGTPKEIQFNGKTITTSIYKSPIQGPIRVNSLNISGDRQADLTVHGGTHKAVMSYDDSNYEWWKSNHPEFSYEIGCFGENLLTNSVDESTALIGDQWFIGSVILEVTQPRQPCIKLSARFQDETMLKKYYNSKRWGLYLKVIQEGEMSPGDPILIKTCDHPTVPAYLLPTIFEVPQSHLKEIQCLLEYEGLCPQLRAKLIRKSNA
ncbi:MAG: MOSC domain-containing protein [Oligoflexia bacterium]|nr:MOSC domain-containing protein [Oligoflexia bacterium]